MLKSFWSVGGTLRKALPLSYTRLGKVTLHHENRIAQFCQSSAKMNWSGILENWKYWIGNFGNFGNFGSSSSSQLGTSLDGERVDSYEGRVKRVRLRWPPPPPPPNIRMTLRRSPCSLEARPGTRRTWPRTLSARSVEARGTGGSVSGRAPAKPWMNSTSRPYPCARSRSS